MNQLLTDARLGIQRFVALTPNIPDEQWQQLDGKLDAQELRWLDALADILPDMESGQRLASLSLPGKETRFFVNEQEIGRIEDAAFGQAFLAIWLDKNTSEKKLREQLLKSLSPTTSTLGFLRADDGTTEA